MFYKLRKYNNGVGNSKCDGSGRRRYISEYKKGYLIDKGVWKGYMLIYCCICFLKMYIYVFIIR